jgi:ribosomal protein L3 glutamine methyltransferase
MAYPDVSVVGADISAEALEVAKINVSKHQLHDRVKLVLSDGLKTMNGTFDCIVCNPPDVCQASMEMNCHKNSKPSPNWHWQAAQMAWTLCANSFIDLPHHMNPEAILILEIGNEREHFENAFPTLEAIWLETSAGEDQVLLLTREALLKHPS